MIIIIITIFNSNNNDNEQLLDLHTDCYAMHNKHTTADD